MLTEIFAQSFGYLIGINSTIWKNVPTKSPAGMFQFALKEVWLVLKYLPDVDDWGVGVGVGVGLGVGMGVGALVNRTTINK